MHKTGCSLGAKASGLGPEDRGFKSLHPDSLFPAVYRLIKPSLLLDFLKVKSGDIDCRIFKKPKIETPNTI